MAQQGTSVMFDGVVMACKQSVESEKAARWFGVRCLWSRSASTEDTHPSYDAADGGTLPA